MVVRRLLLAFPSLVLLFALAGSGSNRRPPTLRADDARLLRSGSCPNLPTGADPDVLDPLNATPNFAVSVTPKGSSNVWWANTSGHPDTFTVTNTGLCQDTYTFTSHGVGPITGISLNKTNATLAPNAQTKVVATYSVTTLGTGTISVTAAGSGPSDSGYYNVTVLSPVISLTPHNGEYRDVGKCVANCFDAVAGYSTPPYFSWDTPHSVNLVYRSAQAKPMGLVQVDVRDTAAADTVKQSIRLQDSQGVFVTFTNGSNELFYKWTAHPADSNRSRLAAQFDATGLTTGAYKYTLVVRTYRSDGTFTEYTAPVRVLLLNEASSPFGAGWSIAGFQHAYVQTADTSLVITEGNGSIAFFPYYSCPVSGCTYRSPRGDFTTVTSVSTVGADSAKYYRRYPDGTTYAFRSDGRLWYVKDRFSNQTQFRYNGSNLLIAITDPAGQTDSLSYDASNHLRWIRDPGGRRDSTTVDGSGNLTRIADWGGGVPFLGTYDVNHRLTHWIDRRSGAWGVSYDFAGKLDADTVCQVTVNGQSVRPIVKYASLEKTVLIDPASGLGTSTNPGANVDTATVRASTANARGFTTTVALDRFGAPTLVQEPLGRTTLVSRDTNSAVVRTQAPSGHIVKYTWNGPDLTQQWDSFTQRKVNYTYESAYHQATLVYGDVDSLINHWTSGRLDSSRVGGSTTWSKYYYYATTARDSIAIDPNSHYTAFFYHGSGFMNTDSVVLSGLTPTSYLYDVHGQLTLVTHHFVFGGDNPQVQYDTTKIVYDSIGRVIRTIGPLHDTTTTTYDALYVTLVRDTKGQTYNSWPNALGWADSTTDPAGAVDRFQFDSAGNRKSWTNRLAQTITFTYDSLNRPRLAVTGTDTIKSFFNPSDTLSVVSNSESVDTVRADFAGRPIWKISCRVLAGSSTPKCFRDSSAYQIRDLDTVLVVRAESIWGAGVQPTVRWHYTAASLLDTLTNFAGEKTSFGYNAEFLMTGITFSGLNSMLLSYEYPWNHVTDIIQISDAGVSASLGRSYNFDGGMRINVRYHGSQTQPDWTRTYSYNAGGQLTGYSDTSHTYAPNGGCSRHLQGETCSGYQSSMFLGKGAYYYDSLGNRKDTSTVAAWTDLGNRLRRLGYLRMDYDAAGNLLAKRTLSSKDSTDTTHVLRRDSLFWSAWGRLDSVHTRDSQNNLTRVGFGYDGSGRRVRKTVGTVTTRFLWYGSSVLMDLTDSGGRVAEYTYYPGVDEMHSVLRHDRNDTTYYFVKDLPGNITGLVARTSSTSLEVADQYDWTPYGESGTVSAPVSNRFGFASREYDVETQFYYNRARYYDPAIGRFVSEDPAGLSGGINLYAYAGDNPIDGRDPSGALVWVSCWVCEYRSGGGPGWGLGRYEGGFDFAWESSGSSSGSGTTPSAPAASPLLPQRPACTEKQKMAATLATRFDEMSSNLAVWAAANDVTAVAFGVLEVPTAGGDTPLTVGFASAGAGLGTLSAVTGAAAAGLNTFASSGDPHALGSFSLSVSAGQVAELVAGRIPFVKRYAKPIGDLFGQETSLITAASEACQ